MCQSLIRIIDSVEVTKNYAMCKKTLNQNRYCRLLSKIIVSIEPYWKALMVLLKGDNLNGDLAIKGRTMPKLR